jgi:hypothetical protein
MNYNNEYKNGFRIAIVIAYLSINGLFFSGQVNAAPEEIQVYSDDKEDAGHSSIDWHFNYDISGRATPDYTGEQPPNHVYRLTPEFNFGLTDTFELGLYVLSTVNTDGNWNGDGYKVRLKYIAPHANQGVYWGGNIEVGEQPLAVAPYSDNFEFKAILGWNLEKLSIALNSNTDVSLNSGSGPATEEFDFNINYLIAGKTQLGIESYNELGSVNKLDSFSSDSKTLYAVINSDIAGHEINAGIGRGFNNPSDQWIVKCIVSTKLW